MRFSAVSLTACLCAGTLTSVSGTMSELGSDLSGLELNVVNVSPSILRVTIGAPGRYTVPQGNLFQNAGVAGASLLASVCQARFCMSGRILSEDNFYCAGPLAPEQ